MRATLWTMVPIVALAGACYGDPAAGPTGGASDDPTFPADPYATVMGEEGQISIEVRTSPSQPPHRGLTAVDLEIKGPDGEPLDGLDLAVTPWMPAMGHGASTRPVIEAKGEGRYLLTKVSLFMPGAWELRSTVSGAAEDHAVIQLQVE